MALRRMLGVMAMAMMPLVAENPFFETWKGPFGAPPFQAIRAEHYQPAFDRALAEHRRELAAIVATKEAPTYRNTIEALDRSGALLWKVQGVFDNLKESDASPALDALSAHLGPILAAHRDDIALDAGLWKRVRTVHDRKNPALTPEQKGVLEKVYRDFVRGGALVAEGSRARFRELNGELSRLETAFAQNLARETNAFRLVLDRPEQLKGLPEALVAQGAEEARKAGQGRWVFTLKAPSIMPFLQFAEDRDLRRTLLAAYQARGAQEGPSDNRPLVGRIAALRCEKARILGFGSWAQFMLADRMVKTPEAAYGLMRSIWTPALAKARTEAADLQALLEADRPGARLEPCDWRYYSEKIRRSRFDLDETAIAPYFELNRVREGAFLMARKLYGVTFHKREDIPLYNPEVKAFEVQEKDGRPLGLLYLDYHTRPSKRGGAWCTTFRDGRLVPGGDVLPLVVNVCNFSRPTGSAPVLLTPDEVRTLFHEFGHGLHALFTRCRTRTATGNLPMDFVELPSQFSENWAFQPQLLKEYARNVTTGAVLPDALAERIQKAGTFNQGFLTTEFVAAALLDMDWHSLTRPEVQDTPAFEKASLDRMGLIPEILPRYRSTYFAHMIGEYSAGYYSYLWSALLEADAFQAFRDKGDLFDPATAAAFRREILARGGAEDPAVMYRRFRGKDPVVEPLLVKRGLK
jgi:peptidyl-dipeptidase Dcp